MSVIDFARPAVVGFADPHESVMEFLAGYSAETTPASAAKVADFRDHLRTGMTVYVTFLPGSDFADTVTLCARLRDEGFRPVPHLAARSIPDAAFLDENLKRLRDAAAVDEVLCIGGAVDTPVGAFSDTMQLLGTGLLDKHGVKRIGVAGHPEGSPDIPPPDVARALQWKNDFAERSDADLYIVIQFCFEAAPIIAWDRAIRAAGNKLPIRIGVPGIATLKTLMNYARACGIGQSMNFLKRQSANVMKLMKTSAPDKLITDLAIYRATDPSCGITGVHMYPLGGLKKTAKWTYAVLDGHFALNGEGGFDVDVDLG